jgi:hypothetical protein
MDAQRLCSKSQCYKDVQVPWSAWMRESGLQAILSVQTCAQTNLSGVGMPRMR